MGFLQLNELEQRMSDDLRWAMEAPEVQQHAGMFVAVYHKRVVGVGTDRDTLVAQAAASAQCPWEHLVVTVVPLADLSDIPH